MLAASTPGPRPAARALAEYGGFEIAMMAGAMIGAAETRRPVLGVPGRSRARSGGDSLLSIVQMPKGIPVGTLAIGEAGAANAGLLAAAILATTDPALAERLEAWRAAQSAAVGEAPRDE